MLTKTWFHTGVWADERSRLRAQMEVERFQEDSSAAHLPDPLSAFGEGTLQTAREARDAARVLRGSMLRQEVYSLDGTIPQRPYVVSERAYAVRRVQPAGQPNAYGGAAEARPAEREHGAPPVFFAHAREALDSHYERNPLDPRVAQGYVLDVDAFGTVLKTAAVAYPRRAAAPGVPEQAKVAITCTESTVAHVTADPDGWRLAVPVETKAYELTGLVVTTGGGGAVVPFTWDAVSTAVSTAAEIPYHQAPAGGAPPPLEKRLLAQVKALYWNAALSGPLALGSADRRALVYETYRLAFTPAGLTAAYGAGRVTDAMLTEGGYVHLGDLDWWVPSGRATPVVSHFYRPTTVTDPFGSATTIAYDVHEMLVTSVTDALGNVVTASGRDYRLLVPVEMTDPNGNRTAVAVDALGRVTALAVMGKVGAGEGDTLADPTVTFEYFDTQWQQVVPKPNYVKTRARELHGPSNPRWLETYAYSDGSGNVVMTKVPAEPGQAPQLDANGDPVYDGSGNLLFEFAPTRWVGTGRTVLDNKGNVVKQYEPFYSATSAYEDDEDLVKWGVTPILRYDPVGRLVRTELPDGTIARVTFDPWKQESFDPNDTVLDPDCQWYLTRQPSYVPTPSPEDQRAATLAYAHANTAPESHLDPLGRTVLAIEDNGAAGQYQTRVAYDVEGNAKTVTDARGNSAASTTYGHGGAVLHHVSNDAGERWMLADVQGAPLRGWDQRGHVVRVSYDALRRPTHVYVSGGALPAEILRQRTLYGELLSDVLTRNLRGRAYQVWDGAGLAVNERFDFKGNPTEARRRLATAYTTEPDWTVLATVTDPSLTESTAASAGLLETGSFTTTAAFDALSRPTSLTTPDASEQRPTYNVSGLLEKVESRLRNAGTWTTFIDALEYDVRGRRSKVTYGSGVYTDYTYDALSFRLTRIETTRPSDGKKLQDLRYTYDAVGNVVELKNVADDLVFFANVQVTPNAQYWYDPIYRLTQATGREHNTPLNDVARDHQDLARGDVPENAAALRNYTETYTYDAVGNFLTFHHDATPTATWTRTYATATANNRLLNDGGTPYTYDAHGNMTSMPHLSSMVWNTLDQLREVNLGGGGTAYYTYGADGQRVRKVVVHTGSTVDETVYLGAWERYRRTVSSALQTEREFLHVSDDVRRIALVDTKTWTGGVPVGSPVPSPRLQIDNHLGTSLLELDGTGAVITYEEYHPYGTTAYHAAKSGVDVSLKRYRYTAKERDEETGLYYHGARYYACWLGRWTAADPAGMVDGPCLYAYARSNPVRFGDLAGMGAHEPFPLCEGLPVGTEPGPSPKKHAKPDASRPVAVPSSAPAGPPAPPSGLDPDRASARASSSAGRPADARATVDALPSDTDELLALGTTLSPEHHRIRAAADPYRHLEVPGFSLAELLEYEAKKHISFSEAGAEYIFAFKDFYVTHYRDAILAAAAMYDLPPELLGSDRK